jgi:holo-ACP synthase
LIEHAYWLKQKEIKAMMINQYIEANKVTVVTMRLNIPGPEKKPDWSDKLFEMGSRILKQHLNKMGFAFEAILDANASHYYEHLLILAVKASAVAIKQQMIELENTSEIGRILDIDVMDQEGNCLSRSDFNMEQRQCYLCRDAANVCRREQRHSKEALTEYLIIKAKGLFDK